MSKINFTINPYTSNVLNLQELNQYPIIISVYKFDKDDVEKFSKLYKKIISIGQSILPIIIDTDGGSVYGLLSMVDIIKGCPIPVLTCARGMAMSAGAVLLSCGTVGYRYAMPNTSIMIHEVSTENSGKSYDAGIDATHTHELNSKLFEIMSLNCGHKKTYFENIYLKQKLRADWYMSAKEAQEHKLIDHIGYPEFCLDSLRLSLNS